MACFIFAQISIDNRDEYMKYETGFDSIFENYRGKVLIVDDDPVVLEGDWKYSRAVLIRFPNEEEARRWFDSPEYRELARIRHANSTGDIILIQQH